ncbi:hypothetical protein [Vreelandella sp. V005]|uniref:hypothetical protein n=1 Tax=Vreelandella sp. V005 TaxID=3459608 RepID=UPI0040447CDB
MEHQTVIITGDTAGIGLVTARMAAEHAEAPISVTLIKPASIATPFPEHAGNVMEREPTLPPPLYEPRIVARSILYCTEHPRRDM